MPPPPPLASWLADRIRETPARVRVGFPFWLRLFVQRNVAAITIGRRVYLSPAVLEWKEERLDALVRHELTHVRQVARYGLLMFLTIYVRDYIRLRRSGLTAHEAYLAIPFEVEAHRAEADDEAL